MRGLFRRRRERPMPPSTPRVPHGCAAAARARLCGERHRSDETASAVRIARALTAGSRAPAPAGPASSDVIACRESRPSCATGSTAAMACPGQPGRRQRSPGRMGAASASHFTHTRPVSAMGSSSALASPTPSPRPRAATRAAHDTRDLLQYASRDNAHAAGASESITITVPGSAAPPVAKRSARSAPPRICSVLTARLAVHVQRCAAYRVVAEVSAPADALKVSPYTPALLALLPTRRRRCPATRRNTDP